MAFKFTKLHIGNAATTVGGFAFKKLTTQSGGGETPDVPDTPETYTLSGTWMFNDEPEIPSASIEQIISFTSNSVLYERIYVLVSFGGSIVYDSLIYIVYAPSDSWSDTAYKTVDFGSTPQVVSEEFYNWFTANAVLQSDEPEEPDTPEATEGLAYELSADGTYYICSGIGTETATDIVIASEIDGIPVKEIGDSAFDGCSRLTSVTIGDSVTKIGIRAFNMCFRLPSITIPDSVISIGLTAFNDCSSLKSITIGSGLTSIGWGAFGLCDALKDVYYVGTEEQWNAISIDSGNTLLTSATIHYNYVPTQTLTVINFNNESEIATFTMPYGFTFSDFIGSEYDTSDGKFGVYNDDDPTVTYNGVVLTLEPITIDLTSPTDIASGTFYYAGEAAPELTKLTIYYVEDGGVGIVRAVYDVPVGMTFEELVDSEYNTNGHFSLTSEGDYQVVLYKGESLNCTVTGRPEPMVHIVYANIIANDGEFYFCCGEEPTQTLRVENFNNAEEYTEYTMPLNTLWSEFVTTQTESGNTSFTIVDGFVKYNGLTLWSDISGGVSVTANSVAIGTVYYRGTHPETQTLTIVNSQYDNEVIAEFTMPWGYLFKDFVGNKDYDTSGGAFTWGSASGYRMCYYKGCSLYTEDYGDAIGAQEALYARGIFAINATPFNVVDLATNESTTYYSERADFFGYVTGNPSNYDRMFALSDVLDGDVYYNGCPLVDENGQAISVWEKAEGTFYYESEGVVSGTWVFNNKIKRFGQVSAEDSGFGIGGYFPEGFISNVLGTGKTYYELGSVPGIYEDKDYDYISYLISPDDRPADGTIVCKSTTGWVNDGYRTITFNAETTVDGKFYGWLKENAKQVT